MQPVEQLNLKHVLQTVCVLEAVVLRSFGPNGGQVLFTRDTGQLMLSRSGKRILTALRLDHPLARMVVECVWKHSIAVGDGSKSFVLLLASLLRGIQTVICKEPHVSHIYTTRAAEQAATARHLAEELLTFGLEDLGHVIRVGVVPYGGALSWESETPGETRGSLHANAEAFTVQRLLMAFFHTRLGRTHADAISHLTRDLLSRWRNPADTPSLSLRFLMDNFPALHTSARGLPATCSRLIEGQVIHRDFSTPQPHRDHQQPVRAVAVNARLQPSVLLEGAVLEVGIGEKSVESEKGEEAGGIVRYSAWTERCLDRVIDTLLGLSVTLLLSAVKQSEAALAAARLAGIRVVECVDEDELCLFARLSGARPVSDCRRIGQEHVAALSFCKAILLGAQRYVHIAFIEPEVRPGVQPCSLVVCGPGAGQTDQCVCAVQDALRMLLAMCEPSPQTGTSSNSGSSPRKVPSTNLEGFVEEASRPAGAPAPGSLSERGCVVQAGGAFEFLLRDALLQHRYVRSAPKPLARRLLADALLNVARHIHADRPRLFLQSQIQVSVSVKEGGCKGNVPPDGGAQSHSCPRKVDLGSESGLESVFCKYQLILAVLQCLRSLLRVDAVLHTQQNVTNK